MLTTSFHGSVIQLTSDTTLFLPIQSATGTKGTIWLPKIILKIGLIEMLIGQINYHIFTKKKEY
ncbi:MAG: hypothetical protein A2162_10220 [Deltaproteobacteria bacterium RBG_13_52_11b]|nr:MAG: hypothetical protein A2162_10220 [Deltaproteobacteria bacterium RBG_13_52_11b]